MDIRKILEDKINGVILQDSNIREDITTDEIMKRLIYNISPDDIYNAIPQKEELKKIADDLYSLPRDKWEATFRAFLEKWNFDGYTYPYHFILRKYYDEDACATILPFFTIRPYYWGDDEGIIGLPNFEYKGVKISWYKYPFRGATINKNISYNEFSEMLHELDKKIEAFVENKKP